jgi:hypothetical protein
VQASEIAGGAGAGFVGGGLKDTPLVLALGEAVTGVVESVGEPLVESDGARAALVAVFVRTGA